MSLCAQESHVVGKCRGSIEQTAKMPSVADVRHPGKSKFCFKPIFFLVGFSRKAGAPSPRHDNTLDSEQNVQRRHSCWAPIPYMASCLCSFECCNDKKHERRRLSGRSPSCVSSCRTRWGQVSPFAWGEHKGNIFFQSRNHQAVGVDFLENLFKNQGWSLSVHFGVDDSRQCHPWIIGRAAPGTRQAQCHCMSGWQVPRIKHAWICWATWLSHSKLFWVSVFLFA